MPLTAEALKTQLERQQHEAARLEQSVASNRARLAQAEQEFAAIKAEKRNPDENPSIHQQRFATASTAERMTRARLGEEERALDRARAEVERLSGMVFAETRIAQATEAAASSARLVVSANQALGAADKALARIDEMIAAEQRAFEIARTAAASQLLATIKANGDTSTLKAPNLDKVATLELARAEAQQERDAAAAALQAAQTQHRQAAVRVEVARAGLTERAHALALDAYLDALVAMQRQSARAGRSFYAPNNLPELARLRDTGQQ